MGRAPCCEKMGLKKGPWTKEEDDILINYINQNGHGNWRALPKKAGLLRCGKSCRLRWTNYLRPDIKRGNFSKEEEDTIIHLHHALGNRWSAIAARLPGRTDNEIKNVWHTHLKKKLVKQSAIPDPQISETPRPAKLDQYRHETAGGEDSIRSSLSTGGSSRGQPNSPPHSSSSSNDDVSSSNITTSCTSNSNTTENDAEMSCLLLNNLNEDFWLDLDFVSCENSWKFIGGEDVGDYCNSSFIINNSTSISDDDINFWSDPFPRAEELPQF